METILFFTNNEYILLYLNNTYIKNISDQFNNLTNVYPDYFSMIQLPCNIGYK